MALFIETDLFVDAYWLRLGGVRSCTLAEEFLGGTVSGSLYNTSDVFPFCQVQQFIVDVTSIFFTPESTELVMIFSIIMWNCLEEL